VTAQETPMATVLASQMGRGQARTSAEKIRVNPRSSASYPCTLERLPSMKEVAVIGAGLMGHGIAQVFGLADYDVRLHDLTEEQVQRAIESIRENLKLFMQNRLVTSEDAERCLQRIKGVTDLRDAVERADLVIEAVFEDLRLKQEVFAQMGRLCPEHTIMASNTSWLSVNRIAESSPCPERVIVAHFWNPPHIMGVVEVVPADRTAPAVVDGICAVLRKCGKHPVVLRKDVPGHIGNRLQFALFREALAIVERGIASPEDVDAVVEMTFGRRLPVTGPMKTADLAGLDLFLAISKYLFKEIENSTEPPRLLVDAVKRGNLGAKTGRGLLAWQPGKAEQIKVQRDAELLRWLKAAGK